MIRKIETQETIEKRDKRNKLIIGGILIFLMVFSTAGFAFLNNERTATGPVYNYNNYEFALNQNGFWQTTINNQVYQFQNFPNETEDISLKGFNLNFYSGRPLYFISESPDATSEIAGNLARVIPRTPQEVCLAGQNCTGDFPEKDCSLDNIIIIRENNESKVYSQENCVFIEGQYSELIKLSDSFLYRMLGVK